MTPEQWRQTEELYHLARERGPSVLSGADPDLKREVEELLAEDGAGKILDERFFPNRKRSASGRGSVPIG